ncbi:restriction endonuclease subunit S [Lactiplantibacillus pentosus]|jgi:type I restriction enzyme S subunit|uniref:restriction endonuclease subunit S n=1 Tax=Lactiplantibacillus pentosus TaxID=1589 RepID=UPI0021A67FF1|nr:restriction endonuclease subunit S [Lactiplantibacillus pentosus]
MKNENLVPKVRFKGFSDPWEQRKLQQIANVFDGTHQTPQYVPSGVPFLSVENIRTLETDKYISEGAFQENFKVVPQKGDIFMTRIGDIGTANIVKSNDDLAYYVSLALIKPERIKSQYLAYFLSSPSGQSQLWKRTLHVAFPKKINKNEIGKIDISFPDSGEQEKIGISITKLSDLIAANEDKLEQLKMLKKLLMQKIFSQEWRFKGFTDPWEQRKLVDLTNVKDGTHDSPKYQSSGIPLVTSKNLTPEGLTLNKALLISNADYDRINQRSKVDAGDIIFGMIGTIGNPVLVTHANFGIKNVALIKNSKKINNLFLLELLKSSVFSRYVFRENAGGTQKFLSLNIIRKFQFRLPNIHEQKHIGNSLMLLNNLIAANEDKLQQLKELKKYLMQNMFV